MPRYPSAMFGRRIPLREFEQSRHHYAPFVLRDFSDPERCRELARLCEVLFAWADRFRSGSPKAFIYAGAVSDDQIDRFFEHIEQECRRLAPISGGLNPPLVSGGWQAELSGHIGSIEAINRLLTGDVVWEPTSVDTLSGEPVGEWEKRRVRTSRIMRKSSGVSPLRMRKRRYWSLRGKPCSKTTSEPTAWRP